MSARHTLLSGLAFLLLATAVPAETCWQDPKDPKRPMNSSDALALLGEEETWHAVEQALDRVAEIRRKEEPDWDSRNYELDGPGIEAFSSLCLIAPELTHRGSELLDLFTQAKPELAGMNGPIVMVSTLLRMGVSEGDIVDRIDWMAHNPTSVPWSIKNAKSRLGFIHTTFPVSCSALHSHNIRRKLLVPSHCLYQRVPGGANQ